MDIDEPGGERRTTALLDAAPPCPTRADSHATRLAARLLSGPLTAGLLVLATAQVLTWLPHYLTWPYWADHDVFATAARAWTRGALPYRDTVGNNFPGTLYLFLLIGKTVGWGRPWAFYAFDAGLQLVLGATLLAWSRRRFGAVLPGAVGWLGLLSITLNLDYCHAAQRDLQGPAFAVLGLLTVQAWPGRAGRVAAGLLGAAAIVVRPQTVLLLPATWVAVRDSRDNRWPEVREWLAALTIGLVLAFMPLALAGVLGDFVRSVRVAAYGGGYNRVTGASFLKGWFLQASALRWWVVPAATALIGAPFATRSTRTALPWFWALAGVSLYKPLSPVAHSYLDLPIALVAVIATAVLAGVILDSKGAPQLRLAGLFLALGLGPATLRPEFCVPGPTLRAMTSWARGTSPEGIPPGYRKGSVPTSAFYPWPDYRALIDYLRDSTTPGTAVANLLMGDPAVTSMADRPSALPAESVAWLRMVRRGDASRFAASLEDAENSVVVWVPGEVGPDPSFTINELTTVVRQRYEFEARFGLIELWRRRTGQ
jgi:hypothetical protein